jgi:hypothetical protein
MKTGKNIMSKTFSGLELMRILEKNGYIFVRQKGDDMKIKIILTPEDEGGYSVRVPSLDGCFTQGETIEEAI